MVVTYSITFMQYLWVQQGHPRLSHGRLKRNKGIYDLSAEHADKLYRAVTHPDEEHRLGLRSLGQAAGMYRSRCFAYHLNII